MPTGALDITLYRDDLMRHAVGPQPVIRRTEIPFSLDDRLILLVDDVLYTGRTIRAALDALIDFGRPERDSARRARRSRAPRAADPRRLRRPQHPDLASAERAGAADRKSTAATKWRWRDEHRHRACAAATCSASPSSSPAEIDLILETALAMKEVGTRPIKKVPTLRGRTIINLFFEPSTRTRMSFELAEKRLSADTLGHDHRRARASSRARRSPTPRGRSRRCRRT